MIEMNNLRSLFAPADHTDRVYGICPCVVTNNKDPEGLGRVKVCMPWLSDEDESNWARVLTPMAGADRGIYFLPEVDDEVLVAFEHGDIRFPYVLGALWNGKDKPPEKNDDGKNDRRTIRSRSGHTITLDDAGGDEKIIICDKTGQNKIVFSSKNNAITIKARGDLTIEAGGKLTLNSGGDMILESKGKGSVKSASSLTLEGRAKSELKGAQVSVSGSAQTEVKGGLVRIN